MHKAIFGGSFNPVHNGHVAICHYIIDNGLAEGILVIPCFAHAFDKSLVAFEHRIEMCRLGLGALPHVEISTIEKELGGKSYTARTIRALQQRDPSHHYALVVGSDILATEFDRWEEPEWLRTNVPFIEIPRGDNSPIPNLSSTELRVRINRSEAIDPYTPPQIAQYIRANNLYVT